jgi:hypothetical protein
MQRLQLSGEAAPDEQVHDSDEEQGPVVPAKGAAAKEKNRARGRNSSMKRYLRKKRQNVVDANTIALREKYQHEKARRREEHLKRQNQYEPPRKHEPSALDLFARNRGPRS